MSAHPPTSYDDVPYASHPFAYTHPDHLATLATLFGLSPASTEGCRVLELGCAAGGNLIPMAEALPGSRFRGVDLSLRQVEEGQRTIRLLALDNVRLDHASIEDVDASWGEFDYVICHGVYSWVPPAVQAAILRVCRENLAPHGVAYVSYNTYPGWHMRAMVREMMNYHVGQFEGNEERIGQARALLGFLTDAVPREGGPYGVLLHQELDILRDRADSYLFHEHLEEHNEPVYFYRFAEQAAAAGLRFLAEAQLADMLPGQFAPEVAATLDRVAPDLVRMEQYMDFVRNRMFRRTLLCRSDVEPTRSLGPECLRGRYVAGNLVPGDEEPDMDPGVPVTFKHQYGALVTVEDPLHKAALVLLGGVWPATVPVEALAALARDMVGGAGDPEADAAALRGALLDCYAANLLEVRLTTHRFAREPGPRPRGTSIARLQAEGGRAVTNRRHEQVGLGALGRQLLCLLDGTRDQGALTDAAVELVGRGDLVVEEGELPVDEPRKLAAVLGEAVERSLEDLARSAVLEPEST